MVRSEILDDFASYFVVFYNPLSLNDLSSTFLHLSSTFTILFAKPILTATVIAKSGI